MNNKVILALALCGLWASVESTVIIATTATAATAAATGLAYLGLGALAVAKGALIGTLLSRGKRDVSEQDQSIEIALDIAQQIDPAGCVAKMLCEVEALPESQLTPAMATLKSAFGNPNEPGFNKRKSSRGIFYLAINFGSKEAKNDPKACARLFDKCPLGRAELFEMVESTFAC